MRVLIFVLFLFNSVEIYSQSVNKIEVVRLIPSHPFRDTITFRNQFKTVIDLKRLTFKKYKYYIGIPIRIDKEKINTDSKVQLDQLVLKLDFDLIESDSIGNNCDFKCIERIRYFNSENLISTCYISEPLYCYSDEVKKILYEFFNFIHSIAE